MTQMQVLLFASYAEAFGAGTVSVSVSAPAKVSDVIAALRSLPGGAALPARPLVAIDRSYTRDDCIVHAGQEVALIPPVAGG